MSLKYVLASCLVASSGVSVLADCVLCVCLLGVCPYVCLLANGLFCPSVANVCPLSVCLDGVFPALLENWCDGAIAEWCMCLVLPWCGGLMCV